jgi:KinB signaling pathway activation protein
MSTLLVGGLATGIIGFIVRWDEFQPYFVDFDILKILSTLFWLFGVGLIFSVVSQMGFFAYLTVHRFGLGIFRSLWNGAQIVLVLFVLFDIIYFRYKAFGGGITPYVIDALILVVAALGIAYIKAKQTNKDAFIPAVFFMVVVTVIEWVPVLRVNDDSWVHLMLFPLLICNAYQLLILHKLNQKSALEKKPSK